MAKHFNLNFTIYKDDYQDLVKKAQELKVKCVTPGRLRNIPWEPGDLCEESWLTFRGTKTSLIELAAFDHHLHGGGFSFNEEDVMDCFE